MTVKKARTVVCTECLCRGYEVMATFSDGCVLAWRNIELNDGFVADYRPLCSNDKSHIVNVDKIKHDESWRCEHWKHYIVAIQLVLMSL